MKSTLFKLTALAGVMGAGFLVVYQAQQELTQSTTQDESSPAEENIEGDPSADNTFRSPAELLADSDETSNDPSPFAGDEFSPPDQSEPTPALGESSERDIAPFASPDEPEVAQTPQESTETENDSSNPFANLLETLSDRVKTSVAGTDTTETDAPEFTPAGFASIDDQSDRPTIKTAEFDPFQSGGEEQPSADESLSASATDNVPTPLNMPDQGEPGGLTALDPNDDTQLVSPPVDLTPTESTADASHQPETLSEAGDVDETMVPDGALAQLSQDERSSGGATLNPFSIFPEEPATATLPDRQSGVPAGRAQPQFEPNPFGDTNPAHPSEHPKVYPDGSIEMTIPQRNDGGTAPDSPDGFDPFAGLEIPGRPDRLQPKVDPNIQPASGELRPLFEDEEEPEHTPDVEDSPPLFDITPREGLQLNLVPREDTQPLENPPLLDNLQPSDSLPAFDEPPAIETPPAVDNVTPPVQPNMFDGIGTVTADAPTGTRQAQVTIEKIAQPEAVVNKPMIYSIKVRNIGQSPAENVVVKDMTPKGSRLEGTKPQAELDEREQKLIWRLGALQPGEERIIQVKVVPTEARQIGSVATVTFEAAVAARTTITAPDLKLSVDGLSEVRVGEKASYKFTITNVGSADATGVFVRNLIPKGFQHPRGDDLEYDIGTLPKGQSKDVTLTLLAVAPGQFDNRAILGAEGDIEVEARKSVSILTSRLKVHRQGPANRFVGRMALFTNTIINESSEPVRNITVQETVPTGVEFSRASDGGRFDPQTRTITWQLPGLRPGDKRQLQSEVKPITQGEWSTTVKAFDQSRDMAEATSQLIVAGFSSLSINVSHAGRPVTIGEEVALRLTIRNRGTAAASQVRAVVQIPPEMKFVDAKGPVRHRELPGNQIEFEALNTLDVNGEEEFDIVLEAARQGRDARVKVELTSAELTSPLNKDEQVVILSESE
ncbi:MAG: DUF11 domain-containing protein [Planctomycetaceae bacterium]|nr:DUF11 domain-containing protein [Planctomycetaceae bacterium]